MNKHIRKKVTRKTVESDYKEYKNIAKDIRRQVVRMHTFSQSSHIGSALSCVDILVILFFNTLRVNYKDLNSKKRDRFILSKGHAVSALYAILAEKGFCSKEILRQYCVNSGRLLGHCTRGYFPGLEASTGSLGHGLSMGIGMAMAARYDKVNYRTYVLLSDGECNEGSVWEAAMFAGHHKLDNLIAIVDYNKLQAFGRTREILDLEPFRNKWESFGWRTKEIDGHSFLQIFKVFEKIPFRKGRPSVVIAHTIKGKGVSFMEDKVQWHYKAPNQEQLEMALEELK